MPRTAGQLGLAPENCICDPFDLAALGHMTNCPARVVVRVKLMNDHALKYHRGFLWLGIYVYTKWNMPWLAHQCAVELMAMEANYPEIGPVFS